MMSENVSAVWKAMRRGYENVGGTWKSIIAAYENVGGVWKLMAAFGDITTSLASGGNTFSCDCAVQSDGQYYIGDFAGGAAYQAWVTPQNSTYAALYQVKVDVTSGSLDLGTTGTWLDCSTTRSWVKTTVGTVVMTFSFREKGSTVVVRTIAGVSMTVS